MRYISTRCTMPVNPATWNIRPHFAKRKPTHQLAIINSFCAGIIEQSEQYTIEFIVASSHQSNHLKRKSIHLHFDENNTQRVFAAAYGNALFVCLFSA